MLRLFCLVLCLKSITGFGQIIVSPAFLGGLPSELQESSGLLIQSPDTLWSHNDSGNGSKVYAFNTYGDKLAERKFDNISNKDWEEITKDDKGHIFLADFGNNLNDRQDLIILRFSSGFQSKTQPLVVDSIQFTYEDQYFFPPPASSLNFDCEAMIVLNDTIFLFTKDRTNPYKSKTLLYWLPAQPGTHIAKYKGSYNTLVPLFLQGSITGAALSPDKTKLVLLGYLRMWLFENFEGSNFFKGKTTVFQFEDYTQKEAVAFLDNCTVYLTDEVNSTLFNGGKLYAADLCSYLNTTQPEGAATCKVWYDDSSSELHVASENAVDEVLICDSRGMVINQYKNPKEMNSGRYFTGYRLTPGIYTYTIKNRNRVVSGKFIVKQ